MKDKSTIGSSNFTIPGGSKQKPQSELSVNEVQSRLGMNDAEIKQQRKQGKTQLVIL